MSDTSRTLEELARLVLREVGTLTGYYTFFDGRSEDPQVVEGSGVWGAYRCVRFVAAPTRSHQSVFDWWDLELIELAETPGVWRLEVRAPTLTHPGWGRREVASGTLNDTDEQVSNHIRYASGPLELLVERRLSRSPGAL